MDRTGRRVTLTTWCTFQWSFSLGLQSLRSAVAYSQDPSRDGTSLAVYSTALVLHLTHDNYGNDREVPLHIFRLPNGPSRTFATDTNVVIPNKSHYGNHCLVWVIILVYFSNFVY